MSAVPMPRPRSSPAPVTPQSSAGKVLEKEIESLNNDFELRIPNPKFRSPGSQSRGNRSIEEQCHIWLKELFWKDRTAFDRSLSDFREQINTNIKDARDNHWVHKPNQDSSTIPSRDNFLRTDDYRRVSDSDRQHRVEVLWNTLRSELWILRDGVDPSQDSQALCRPRNLANGPSRPSDSSNQHPTEVPTPQPKRKSDHDEEVFHTAPNSPTLPTESEYRSLGNLDEYKDPNWDEPYINSHIMEATDGLNMVDQRTMKSKKRQSKITDHMLITKLSRTTESKQPTIDFQKISTSQTGNTFTHNTSFATTVDSIFEPPNQRDPETSFATDITDQLDEALTETDSVEGVMQSAEFSTMLKSIEEQNPASLGTENEQVDIKQNILNKLLQHGPFSKKKTFSAKVPLRAKYELERVRIEWNVDPMQILAGDKPHEQYAGFWNWLGDLGQRLSKKLPEKPSQRAWNSAIDRFQGDRHSEVVVMTGALDWCTKGEPGIFKIRLNPLKMERTCRFHRRFGSDRFLSITIPAPSQSSRHLPDSQSFFCDTITKWLSHYDHFLLGRVWRAFFIDDYKNKNKSKNGEPRFRVDFFAVDGTDFRKLPSPTLSPSGENSHSHTPMTIEQLVDWHIPRSHNQHQTDCKLFNRISLGLSKTWATSVLRPDQIRKLHDTPGQPVMNDGCALMSRPLARAICVELGIDGNTPSCFQGRIAGAKGLWMVDSDQTGDSSWIQISDSQLKIKPHPNDFFGFVDDEKVTFEVTGWAKPLRSSELNAQLLEVLNHRGLPRNRISELARNAISDLYMEFKTVVEKDSIPLARALIQKIRPIPEDGFSRNGIRRIDEWIIQNTETVIRLLEAGFSPRNFIPLRNRLRICLSDTLNRYVNECHIPVPLSTYAYCLADPYGVLEEDEIHFGFSSQWKDCPDFEDAMVDGVDVLVGRTPAHCPWDIQRREAVWKHQLRHFKDVIVFPTKGDTPLASLLSGGDYDGDRPWICWDQGIVQSFMNTTPPPETPKRETFGLISHARSMADINSIEDFLEGTFRFNLTMSNLGRCTVEHDKLVYEEPEGINSPKALELAVLLSYLVDSKKAGLQLTDEAWKQYRKKISPRERRTPAYKDADAKTGKPGNINDFVRFEVAYHERERVLTEFNALCQSVGEEMRDEDLVRPWKTVLTRAEREKNEEANPTLYTALKFLETQISKANHNWAAGCSLDMSISDKVQLAARQLSWIRPPDITHPLGHTWHNSEYEWRTLLASGAYRLYWRSKFPLYAAGETLCWIKTGKEPARLVRDNVYVSMKVNSKAARRLADAEIDDASDVELDNEDSEFDQESVIDALLSLDNDSRLGLR
ncbi:putative RNA-directed RNA polymerase [Talaromyces proteolyticus]|uniref:RNA-dependent RNA polymerase n=1 Tax=Talaromyces proteolyticus TaxID=1131652 RepID=A0AAD4KV38_9EURO|nr:putative RNA-directed RNA polymerase [Talaromyces proteolyticus]KAH8701788.1 putative RNA-directed RNA polymerase [Talaromyces proteolyticus]